MALLVKCGVILFVHIWVGGIQTAFLEIPCIVSKRVDLNCLVFHGCTQLIINPDLPAVLDVFGWPAQAPRVWLCWNPKIWSFQPTQQLGWIFSQCDVQLKADCSSTSKNLICSDPMLSKVVYLIILKHKMKHLHLPRSMATLLGLRNMTLQSGA